MEYRRASNELWRMHTQPIDLDRTDWLSNIIFIFMEIKRIFIWKL